MLLAVLYAFYRAMLCHNMSVCMSIETLYTS